jgi:hypothetical protein
MSEPIKLDPSEVEFWKACVVAVLSDTRLEFVSSADQAVKALRERVDTKPKDAERISSWRQCATCGRKIAAPKGLPLDSFICCNNEMRRMPIEQGVLP